MDIEQRTLELADQLRRTREARRAHDGTQPTNSPEEETQELLHLARELAERETQEEPAEEILRLAHGQVSHLQGKGPGPAAKGYTRRELRRAGLGDVARTLREDKTDSPAAKKYDTFLQQVARHGVDFHNDPGQVYLDPQNRDSWDDVDTIRACGVCNTPLNSITDLDGTVSWLHIRSWEQYDHEPVLALVPRSSIERATCDYCGLDARLNWSYKGARTKIVAGNAGHDYGTIWGACDDCAPIIDTGDLDKLATRVTRVGPLWSETKSPEVRAAMMQRLVDMWGAFFSEPVEKIYTGPRRQPARLDPRMMPKLQQGLLKFWQHPGLYDMVAGHGNHQGQKLPGFCYNDDDKLVYHVEPGEHHTREAFTKFASHVTTGIQAATNDLYWISANFTQLAILAGKEYNEVTLTREQLPSKFGIVVYEEPIATLQRPGGEAEFRAFSWTLVPGGVWVNLYIQGEDADPYIDVTQMRADIGYLLCPNVGTLFPFDIPAELPTDSGLQFARTILATWMLLTQPGVAEETRLPAEKKYARAYQRTYGHKAPDVRVIDLRRTRSRSSTDRTGGPRGPLQYQRYTRGHWKNQFYGPKRGMRKMIYVSPYISGPEGAGLKPKTPTVKVLR